MRLAISVRESEAGTDGALSHGQASIVEQAAEKMLRGPTGQAIAFDIRVYDVLYERV